MKIKVTCIYGEFKKGKDFVLEPYSEGDEEEHEVFWIEKVEEAKGK